MKVSLLGFNLSYATSLKKEVEKNGVKKEIKIDCTDLVIMRWFVDFFPTMKKIEVEGQQYAWLNHKKLMEDLPILDISKRAVIDRMQKLVEFGLLSYKFVKESGTGTFSLYALGENYIKLIEGSQPKEENNDPKEAENTADGGIQISEGVCSQTYTGCMVNHTRGSWSNVYGVAGQTHTKDKLIKDKLIKDNSIIDNNNNNKAPSASHTQSKNELKEIINDYSKGDEELKDLLLAWLEVRTKKRAANTTHAIKLNLDILSKSASESNMEVKDYLKEIIMRGWQKFYPIQDNSQYYSQKTVSTPKNNDISKENIDMKYFEVVAI